jgi:hypothetical protein
MVRSEFGGSALDGPVEPGGGEHYDRSVEPRLSRVENDVRDLKDTLAELKTMVVRMDARLEAILPHLATKADLANLETKPGAMDTKFEARLGGVDAKLGVMDARLDATLPYLATKADLADKPGKTYMWGILAALLTAYTCGLAALAVLK